MNPVLSNCPFCGAQAKLNHVRGNERYNQSWSVDCTKCECRGQVFTGSNSWEQGNEASAPRKLDRKAEKDAVAWWNRRAPLDIRADVLALCEITLRHMYSANFDKPLEAAELIKRLREKMG